jgi:hypothetical protein
MPEYTIYFHNRPDCIFTTARECAEYLWPDDPDRQQLAAEDLESFHETANPERHLMCQRTDELAYVEVA